MTYIILSFAAKVWLDCLEYVSSGLSLDIVLCGRCGFGSRSCSLTYFMS